MMPLIIDRSGECDKRDERGKATQGEKTQNTQIRKERRRTIEHYAKHLIHILLYDINDIYLIRLVYIYKHFFTDLVLFFLQIISGIWRILSAKLGGQN